MGRVSTTAAAQGEFSGSSCDLTNQQPARQPRTELKQPCTVLNCNYTPINNLCRLSLNDSCVRVCVRVYGVNTLLRNFQGVCWYRRVPAEPTLTSRQA